MDYLQKMQFVLYKYIHQHFLQYRFFFLLMLKAILHHRGFNRLAKALFGCHPSLLWHISHKLDTGRTKVLRKFYTDINNDEALKSLTNQILELIPKVSKES